MKSYLVYLTLLSMIIALTSGHEFTCNDHAFFKNCHPTDSKLTSFLYKGDVYCQCNGCQLGSDPEEGCEFRTFLFSNISNKELEFQMSADNVYKLANYGTVYIEDDIRCIYETYAINTPEENPQYAHCSAIMDDFRSQFYLDRDGDIKHENFSLVCSAIHAEKIIPEYVPNRNEWNYVILFSYKIDFRRAGKTIPLARTHSNEIKFKDLRREGKYLYYNNSKGEVKKVDIELAISENFATEELENPHCNGTSCPNKLDERIYKEIGLNRDLLHQSKQIALRKNEEDENRFDKIDEKLSNIIDSIKSLKENVQKLNGIQSSELPPTFATTNSTSQLEDAEKTKIWPWIILIIGLVVLVVLLLFLRYRKTIVMRLHDYYRRRYHPVNQRPDCIFAKYRP